MKTILRSGIAAVGLLGVTGAFIHPFGQIKVQRTSERLLSGAEAPREVARVFERSCQNCHSERTEWPWYSYAPPFSWFIESDVYEARTHMNLSRWHDYTFDQQVEILTRLGAEVRGRQMPPSRYVFLHPDARLSDAEVEQLYKWAHRERRRLRSSARTGR